MTYTYADGTIKQTPISVNGKPLPCPSEITISKEDLHAETERTAAGYLVADLKRSNVVKLSLNWKYLAAADYARLESILGTNMFKPIQYLENGGTYRTISGYKGGISATPHRIMDTGKINGYLNVSVSLIER